MNNDKNLRIKMLNNLNESKARNLKLLAELHKKDCNGDCGISLIIIGEIYKDLVNRKLTEKEERIFM